MVRVLVAFAFMLLAALPAPVAETISISEVMRATALDTIFDQFGPTISAAAGDQQISQNRVFLEHWKDTAQRAYDGPAMRDELVAALEAVLTANDREELGGFFRSELGQRISAAEREVALLSSDAQLAVANEGRTLMSSAAKGRLAQLDRINTPEMARAFVRQGMRAMLVGLSVAGQRGTIVLPWPAIDAQVEAMMPELTKTALDNQKAMMAYAYRDLSDAELDTYIAFLTGPAASKLTQRASEAADVIVTEATHSFGQALAAKMSGVGV
ncbi:DUF2059 domain-containing protein [Devosia sp.]|uniref:DUF2059 domain-containing protein n=1 Tax=Devosia sp. TaxID=1871048 RepID=UPI003BAD728C